VVKTPILVAIVVGVFFAGLGIGLAIQSNHPSYSMMGTTQMQQMMNDPQLMNQWHQQMLQNPQEMNQWMNAMMSNPQTQQQMYQNMFANQQFMQGMMSNQQFQKQWMNSMITNTTSMHMGTGMMGNTMSGPGNFKSISMNDAINEMHKLPEGTKADNENSKITFDSSDVNFTVLAMMKMDAMKLIGDNSMSEDHGEDAFVIGNMINPTLVIKQGTTLHVTIVNMDEDMGHNFQVTTIEPPYAVMPMQAMMNGGSSFLNSMPIIPTEQDEKVYEDTTSLTLTEPGTYYYICTYPGHAAEGMYGKIIVE